MSILGFSMFDGREVTYSPSGGRGFTEDWARASAHWSADKEGTNAPGPRCESISISTVGLHTQTPRTARFMSRPHAAGGDSELFSSSSFKQAVMFFETTRANMIRSRSGPTSRYGSTS